MAILGAGRQARLALEWLGPFLNANKFLVWARRPEAAAELAAHGTVIGVRTNVRI